jgi:O-antigen/teichoic acid export membrane protein
MINALGSGGKLLYPIFLLLITRIYGPSHVGVFLLMLSIIELVSCITIAGFDSGVITFGSRSSANGAEGHFYRVFASALQLSIAASVAVPLLLLIGQPALAAAGWHDGDTAPPFGVMVIALPMMAFTAIVVSATRARLTMRYDALVNGLVRPVALIVVAAAFGSIAPTAASLNLAFVVAQAACAAVALVIVLRQFRERRLLEGVVRRPIDGLVPFSLFAGASAMLNALATSVPIIALGLSGVRPEAIAFFGTALTIASYMRQIRFVFSIAFAPVAARLHAHGDREALAAGYAAVTRWALALTVPVVVLFGVYRREVMRFIHPSYGGDATFILILLLIPMLRCSPAGVVLTSSGYSQWALFNSLLSGATTLAAAWLLVPAHGVMGAAAAAAAGFAVITAAEVAETRVLLKLRLNLFDRGPAPARRLPLSKSDRSSAYPSAPC